MLPALHAGTVAYCFAGARSLAAGLGGVLQKANHPAGLCPRCSRYDRYFLQPRRCLARTEKNREAVAIPCPVAAKQLASEKALFSRGQSLCQIDTACQSEHGQRLLCLPLCGKIAMQLATGVIFLSASCHPILSAHPQAEDALRFVRPYFNPGMDAGFGVYNAERLNRLLGQHWHRFARQPYFDAHGVFISTTVSAPLLLAMFLALVMG